MTASFEASMIENEGSAFLFLFLLFFSLAALVMDIVQADFLPLFAFLHFDFVDDDDARFGIGRAGDAGGAGDERGVRTVPRS